MGVYWTGEEWIPAKWFSDGVYPSINEKMVGKSKLDLLINEKTESEVA
jgi:hypothetical protein